MRNLVQIIGNIGKAPKATAKTKDGKPVVRFAIAQDVTLYDQANKKYTKRDPQWFQITSFGPIAERSLGLVKGELVQITGRLKSSTYENDKGEKRTSVEIIADEVFRMAHPKKANSETISLQNSVEADEIVDFASFDEGALQ